MTAEPVKLEAIHSLFYQFRVRYPLTSEPVLDEQMEPEMITEPV